MAKLITFPAEIVEVKSRKAVSGDRIISVKLETDSAEALELQKFIAEQVVSVKVEGE